MEKKKEILIIVDMQNDFVDGALGTSEASAIADKLDDYIEDFVYNKNGIVYATLDTHDTYYLYTQEGRKLPIEHCIKYTDGWLPTFDTKYVDKFFEKNSFGCRDLLQSISADLYFYMKDGGKVVITLVGVCTDICVISNALMLKSFLPEAEIHVNSDYTAGTSLENKINALKVMTQCQIIVD